MPSPRWYLQRLRCMLLAEVPWRAYRMLRRRLEASRSVTRAEELALDAVVDRSISAADLRQTRPEFPVVGI